MNQTKPVVVRFQDQDQERIRQNFEQRIAELQQWQSDQMTTTQSPTTVIAGLLLNRQVITASGPVVPTKGARRWVARICGGGGGGGGASATVGTVSVAGGGGSGVTIEVTIKDPIAATATVGAPGAGGSSVGGTGGTGGDSALAVGSTTYLAKGGTGASGGTQSGTVFPSAPGIPQAGSTSGVPASGQAGGEGAIISTAGGGLSYPGYGGDGLLGTSASVTVNVVPPTPGGFGGGGTGAQVVGANVAGGQGGPGVIIIDEYS